MWRMGGSRGARALQEAGAGVLPWTCPLACLCLCARKSQPHPLLCEGQPPFPAPTVGLGSWERSPRSCGGRGSGWEPEKLAEEGEEWPGAVGVARPHPSCYLLWAQGLGILVGQHGDPGRALWSGGCLRPGRQHHGQLLPQAAASGGWHVLRPLTATCASYSSGLESSASPSLPPGPWRARAVTPRPPPVCETFSTGGSHASLRCRLDKAPWLCLGKQELTC